MRVKGVDVTQMNSMLPHKNDDRELEQGYCQNPLMDGGYIEKTYQIVQSCVALLNMQCCPRENHENR